MTLIADIELHYDHDIGRRYVEVAPVRARVTSGQYAFLRRERTIEDVNARLREVAIEVGADAVIGVAYKRGISGWSWKALTATGVAVRWVR